MNLFRYLLLRKHDLRNLHDHLSEIGISSLRSSESYVYKNVSDTLQLTKLINKKDWSPATNVASIGYKKSRKIINKHRYDLFGKKTGVRDTKIMVTLPSEAASDIELVRELMINGMELARINMSHDNQETWLSMIKTVHQASKYLKTKCYIYMDLSGPKIRTGEIQTTKKKKKKLPGIVLKIENKEAFEQLPMLLMKAMELPKIGVMIARGDLAVELGAERISEVQDQIMWICEAAHVPVIWATQVLENLAKTGIATRAEVSDASIGAKAECVMLNKGPFIHKAVSTLSDILIRMEKHLSKKKSRMRSLAIASYNMREIPRQILKV